MAIGCAVDAGAVRLERAMPERKRFVQPVSVLLAGLALVLYPLIPLFSYYRESVADGRTNDSIFRLVDSIVAARNTSELVLLDEGLGQEALGAGGNELKAYRMLLGGLGIAFEEGKVSNADEWLSVDSDSVLMLMESKKRSSLPRALTATALSPELESASGSGHRYAVYRLTPGRRR
jgi:hypothetical protein